MKALRYLLAMLLFVATLMPAFASEPIKVRLAQYPPYYFRDESGNWVGIEADVVFEMLRRAGLEYVVVDMSWARGLKSMEDGTLDMMLAVTRLPERESYIDFIGSARSEQVALLVRKENVSVKISSLDDLMHFDKKFGMQVGVFYVGISERCDSDPEFRKHFETSTEEVAGIRKVQYGRAMGFFVDKLYALYEMKRMPEFEGLAIHPFVVHEPHPVFIGASKKLPLEIREKMHRAFEAMEKEGRIQAIVDFWTK